MHHQFGLLPELTAKIRKSLESNSLLDKKVKKSREKFAFSEFCRNSSKKNELFLISLFQNLEDNEKISIIAASNVCFDYAAECVGARLDRHYSI